eukprot:14551-Rhodomonas_salina.1
MQRLELESMVRSCCAPPFSALETEEKPAGRFVKLIVLKGSLKLFLYSATLIVLGLALFSLEVSSLSVSVSLSLSLSLSVSLSL